MILISTKSPKDSSRTELSARIHKTSLVLLLIGLLVDVMLKINLWNFGSNSAKALLMMGMEICLLLIVFHIELFGHAAAGVLIGTAAPTSKFPAKVYLKRSALGALIVSVGLWTLRFIIAGPQELRGGTLVLLCTMLYAVTFLAAFAYLFLAFYVAYRVARRKFS